LVVEEREGGLPSLVGDLTPTMVKRRAFEFGKARRVPMESNVEKKMMLERQGSGVSARLFQEVRPK